MPALIYLYIANDFHKALKKLTFFVKKGANQTCHFSIYKDLENPYQQVYPHYNQAIKLGF